MIADTLLRLAGWGAANGLLLSGLIVVGAALRGGPVWSELLVFGPRPGKRDLRGELAGPRQAGGTARAPWR